MKVLDLLIMLLLVCAFTYLQGVKAIEAADKGNAETQQTPFPVIFSEDEKTDTENYLVKMIRACTILGTTGLRIHNSGTTEFYPIFKGRPPDFYEITNAIIVNQPACKSALSSNDIHTKLWCKNTAEKFGFRAEEKFKTKMEVIRDDPFDEKNCKSSSIYICRDRQKAEKKATDLRREQLIKHEQEYLSQLSPNYTSYGYTQKGCDPQCAMYIRNLWDIVDSTIDSALIERSEYLKTKEIQQQQIAAAKEIQQQEMKIQQQERAAEKSRQEATLKRRQEEDFENYARALKSGSKRIESMYDAKIYYDPIDGSSYATNPPLKFPDEKRYLSLDGVVETINGDTIICTFGDYPNLGRWGFLTSKMKSYVPRQGELVQAIGRIVSLDKGQTLSGRALFYVVIDPEVFAINNSLFYSR